MQSGFAADVLILRTDNHRSPACLIGTSVVCTIIKRGEVVFSSPGTLDLWHERRAWWIRQRSKN